MAGKGKGGKGSGGSNVVEVTFRAIDEASGTIVPNKQEGEATQAIIAGGKDASPVSERSGRGGKSKAAVDVEAKAKVTVDKANVAKQIQDAIDKVENDAFQLTIDTANIVQQIQQSLLQHKFQINLDAHSNVSTAAGPQPTQAAAAASVSRGTPPPDLAQLENRMGTTIRQLHTKLKEVINGFGKVSADGGTFDQMADILEHFGAQKFGDLLDVKRTGAPSAIGGSLSAQNLRSQGVGQMDAEQIEDIVREMTGVNAKGGYADSEAGILVARTRAWMGSTPAQPTGGTPPPPPPPPEAKAATAPPPERPGPVVEPTVHPAIAEVEKLTAQIAKDKGKVPFQDFGLAFPQRDIDRTRKARTAKPLEGDELDNVLNRLSELDEMAKSLDMGLTEARGQGPGDSPGQGTRFGGTGGGNVVRLSEEQRAARGKVFEEIGILENRLSANDQLIAARRKSGAPSPFINDPDPDATARANDQLLRNQLGGKGLIGQVPKRNINGIDVEIEDLMQDLRAGKFQNVFETEAKKGAPSRLIQLQPKTEEEEARAAAMAKQRRPTIEGVGRATPVGPTDALRKAIAARYDEEIAATILSDKQVQNTVRLSAQQGARPKPLVDPGPPVAGSGESGGVISGTGHGFEKGYRAAFRLQETVEQIGKVQGQIDEILDTIQERSLRDQPTDRLRQRLTGREARMGQLEGRKATLMEQALPLTGMSVEDARVAAAAQREQNLLRQRAIARGEGLTDEERLKAGRTSPTYLGARGRASVEAGVLPSHKEVTDQIERLLADPEFVENQAGSTRAIVAQAIQEIISPLEAAVKEPVGLSREKERDRQQDFQKIKRDVYRSFLGESEDVMVSKDDAQGATKEKRGGFNESDRMAEQAVNAAEGGRGRGRVARTVGTRLTGAQTDQGKPEAAPVYDLPTTDVDLQIAQARTRMDAQRQASEQAKRQAEIDATTATQKKFGLTAKIAGGSGLEGLNVPAPQAQAAGAFYNRSLASRTARIQGPSDDDQQLVDRLKEVRAEALKGLSGIAVQTGESQIKYPKIGMLPGTLPAESSPYSPVKPDVEIAQPDNLIEAQRKLARDSGAPKEVITEMLQLLESRTAGAALAPKTRDTKDPLAGDQAREKWAAAGGFTLPTSPKESPFAAFNRGEPMAAGAGGPGGPRRPGRVTDEGSAGGPPGGAGGAGGGPTPDGILHVWVQGGHLDSVGSVTWARAAMDEYLGKKGRTKAGAADAATEEGPVYGPHLSELTKTATLEEQIKARGRIQMIPNAKPDANLPYSMRIANLPKTYVSPEQREAERAAKAASTIAIDPAEQRLNAQRTAAQAQLSKIQVDKAEQARNRQRETSERQATRDRQREAALLRRNARLVDPEGFADIQDTGDDRLSGLRGENRAIQRRVPRRGFGASVTDLVTSVVGRGPLERQLEAADRAQREVNEINQAAGKRDQITSARRGIAQKIREERALPGGGDPERLRELTGLYKEHIASGKSWNAIIRKSTEVFEKNSDIVRKNTAQAFGAAAIGSIGSIGIGALTFGLGSAIAAPLIEGMAQVGQNIVDKAFGSPTAIGATRTQLGEAARGAGGSGEIGFAQVSARAGLAGETYNRERGVLSATAAMEAGNRALTEQINLLKTGERSERGESLFTAGTGGFLDTGLFGNASTQEQIGEFIQQVGASRRNAPQIRPWESQETTQAIQTKSGEWLVGNLELLGERIAEMNDLLDKNNDNLLEIVDGSQFTKDELDRQARELQEAGAPNLAKMAQGGLAGFRDQNTGRTLTGQEVVEMGGESIEKGAVPTPQALLDMTKNARQVQLDLKAALTALQLDQTNPQSQAIALSGQGFGADQPGPGAPPSGTGGVAFSKFDDPQVRKQVNAELQTTKGLYADINKDVQMQLDAAKQFVGQNLPEYASDFSNALDAAQSYAQQISDIQIGLQTKQAEYSAKQFGVQINIAKRSLADAKGLVSGIGDNLGAIERQIYNLQREAQSLSLGQSQAQINFQKAIAGFSAPGLTGEERAARARQAKIEADYAQKQLNIQKELFGLQGRQFNMQANRNVTDLQAQLNLLYEGRELSLETTVAEKKIKALTVAWEKENKKVETIYAAATAHATDMLGLIAEVATAANESMAGVAEVVLDTYATYFKGLERYIRGLNKVAQEVLSGNTSTGHPGKDQDDVYVPPTNAEGAVGTVNGVTSFGPIGIAGEAGGEAFAILRDPKKLMSPMGGGAQTGGTVQIIVQGNKFNTKEEQDELVRKLTYEVSQAQARNMALTGLR